MIRPRGKFIDETFEVDVKEKIFILSKQVRMMKFWPKTKLQGKIDRLKVENSYSGFISNFSFRNVMLSNKVSNYFKRKPELKTNCLQLFQSIFLHDSDFYTTRQFYRIYKNKFDENFFSCFPYFFLFLYWKKKSRVLFYLVYYWFLYDWILGFYIIFQTWSMNFLWNETKIFLIVVEMTKDLKASFKMQNTT